MECLSINDDSKSIIAERRVFINNTSKYYLNGNEIGQ